MFDDTGKPKPLTRAEQFALFRQMTEKKKARLPEYVASVEREEDNATFFITFNKATSSDIGNAIAKIIMSDHSDYVSHAQWTTTDKLLVRLRRPRRDIEPDSRRAARCDIAVIASEIFSRYC
jgi:hypothetical protein